MQMQRLRIPVGKDKGFVGGDDVGRGWLRQVSEEDVPPEGCARSGENVLDVQHVVLEVFVEDTRLDFKGGLRGLAFGLEFEECGRCVWSDVERVDQSNSAGEG